MFRFDLDFFFLLIWFKALLLRLETLLSLFPRCLEGSFGADSPPLASKVVRIVSSSLLMFSFSFLNHHLQLEKETGDLCVPEAFAFCLDIQRSSRKTLDC